MWCVIWVHIKLPYQATAVLPKISPTWVKSVSLRLFRYLHNVEILPICIFTAIQGGMDTISLEFGINIWIQLYELRNGGSVKRLSLDTVIEDWFQTQLKHLNMLTRRNSILRQGGPHMWSRKKGLFSYRPTGNMSLSWYYVKNVKVSVYFLLLDKIGSYICRRNSRYAIA